MSQVPRGIPEPTEIAGRYQVVQKLGAGAFGTVYKAKDKILGRMVAIKTIRMEGLAAAAAGVEEMVARFEREARVSAQLKHPNIVTIYDVGQSEGLSYLAMEFIDGVGLEKVIAQAGRLPVERVASIGGQVADALDFAHKNGVVHRDIKPANIMIEAGDRVKVTDFGIAKATDSGEHLTVTGSLLGTPSYMSPEQARGAPLDGRSDLFSVGCVLYEMVTGRKAFRGESITALLFKIITEEPPPIREADVDIPEALERIILKSLSKAQEMRYATGAELRADLMALTQPGSLPTLRHAEMATAKQPPVIETVVNAPPPTRVAAPAPRPGPRPPAPRPESPPPAPLTSPAPRRGGSALPLVVLAVVLLGFLGVAAVGAWFLFLRRPAGPAVAVQTLPAQPPPTPAPEVSVPSATQPPVSQPEATATPPATTLAPAPAAPRVADTRRAPVATAPRSAQPPTATDTAEAEGGSFLDEPVAEAEPDGREAGRRVAEGFRGGTASSGFGATGRLQAREKTPSNLLVVERPAVATMRHVINAQESFYRRNSRYGNLLELKEARTLFLDVPVQANAFVRRGYRFEVASTGSGFTIAAIPVAAGGRPFTGDDSGIIRAGVD
ncbi:MAG TPA: serine/threonine-protein kinase [Vicinamibacteria bacterium]|nr:serine/threonine-protein kinase [Vicinamibacteria bacterium]